jgi:hypothetical protein
VNLVEWIVNLYPNSHWSNFIVTEDFYSPIASDSDQYDEPRHVTVMVSQNHANTQACIRQQTTQNHFLGKSVSTIVRMKTKQEMEGKIKNMKDWELKMLYEEKFNIQRINQPNFLNLKIFAVEEIFHVHYIALD